MELAIIENETKCRRVFCQMDSLQGDCGWKEAARWLKFEEHVEESGRWSRPHVATLTYTSITELKNALANGVVCLDLQGGTAENIIGKSSNLIKLSKLITISKLYPR